MRLFDIFKRNKQPDLETIGRAFLGQKGRITDGIIIDNELTEAGEEIVYYIYSIQGVDFESSEVLTAEQKENSLQYAPGAKVGIRFDPKNHGNSMLV